MAEDTTNSGQADIFNFNWNSNTLTDTYSRLLTGNNYIYIYHLPSDQTGEGTYLYIPVWPDEISDTISTSFQQENALSRSAPVIVFSNAGPRKVQFNLQLHRDMMDEANSNITSLPLEDTEDYIDYLVRTLQAISLPNYHAGNKEVEPPMIAVRFGDDIFVKGVVDGGIGVSYKKPILSNDKYALIDITFAVTEVDPMDAVSLQKVGSFRNISKTFKNLI